MCDYSLHGIKNRMAEKAETLVVHRFHTGSKGLTSPEYLIPIQKPKGFIAILKSLFDVQPGECAVCIPDGARLMLHGVSAKLQQTHDLSTTEAITFRQLSPNGGTYRDAVEFKNGGMIRLQDLEEGQTVEVLALSSEEASVQEALSLSGNAI